MCCFVFLGFRAVGFGWIVSFFGMLFVNGAMSYRTQEVKKDLSIQSVLFLQLSIWFL